MIEFPPLTQKTANLVVEAQAKRIAELEAELERLDSFDVGLDAALAKLEAELARCEELRDEYHRLAMSGPNAELKAELAALKAELTEWQQMYREMATAAENLRERLLCMAPNDTEAKCWSLRAELAALKCCGNCGNIHTYNAGTDDEFKECPYLREDDADHDYLSIGCHYDPSRWAARAEEGREK